MAPRVQSACFFIVGHREAAPKARAHIKSHTHTNEAMPLWLWLDDNLLSVFTGKIGRASEEESRLPAGKSTGIEKSELAAVKRAKKSLISMRPVQPIRNTRLFYRLSTGIGCIELYRPSYVRVR